MGLSHNDATCTLCKELRYGNCQLKREEQAPSPGKCIQGCKTNLGPLTPEEPEVVDPTANRWPSETALEGTGGPCVRVTESSEP